MQNTLGTLRYTLRQFRQSPVFTSAAIVTLALGIGGTTAIFTLIHAVMLRSLPVSDPALLYRIGDGDDCCVEGGPQDRWGMYSFPLYERLESSDARIPRSSRLSGRRGPDQRETPRRCHRVQIPRVGIRDGQLFLDTGGQGVRRPSAYARRRQAVFPASGCDQPSKLAVGIRSRSFGGGRYLCYRRASLHHRRRDSAWIFRRHIA